MMKQQTHDGSNKTGIALLTGLAIGAGVALLLPDNWKRSVRRKGEEVADQVGALLTDPEERERIAEIFQEKTKNAQTIYNDARTKLAEVLESTGEAIESIDKRKYRKAVSDTMAYIREQHKVPKESLARLRTYLENDLSRLRGDAEEMTSDEQTMG